MKRIALISLLVAACGDPVEQQSFAPPRRTPGILSTAEIDHAARSALLPGEVLVAAHAYPAAGLGESVVQFVASRDDVDLALVVDATGRRTMAADFWRSEQAARLAAFGRMTPELFAKVHDRDSPDESDVEITIAVDLPETQLLMDGTDVRVATEDFERWFAQHSNEQQARIAEQKQRILDTLHSNGGRVIANFRGLPIIRAAVSRATLLNPDMHRGDVLSISSIPEEGGELLGHAGRASMLEGQLVGGTCGGACDGGLIDVGLWEVDSATFFSGLARNSARINAPSSVVTAYMNTPKPCSSDADCSGPSDVFRSCRAVASGGPKQCVQDHLTWVAASVGMNGGYAYNSTVPTSDSNANVPAGTTLPASGAWRVDYRVGNDPSMAGFDFLIAPPPSTGPATPYINRSQGIVLDFVNWAGRAFGTFVTVASGNTDAGVVNGARLKNGMVVGAYSYMSYVDQSSHRRTTGIDGVHGSAFVNDATVDSALERPHILGPGFHQPSNSGLHLPAIDVGVGQWNMRTADYSSPPSQIFGTSFAAPALLGAAILAHQYEGWFSALAFPMVNKAVLLASTVDANNDGNIGKGWVWFPQSSDAEDGAGQVSFFNLKRVLDSNTYTYFDLSDSNFSSCGTNCREFIAASVSIPANSSFRAAMAWQSCLTSESGTPTLNNDLDLVLSCGSPLIVCGGTLASSSITSEIEMVSKAACTAPKSCTLRIRIKNGASLAACGSTSTERVGLAWRL
jgi:hypothetical protein